MDAICIPAILSIPKIASLPILGFEITLYMACILLSAYHLCWTSPSAIICLDLCCFAALLGISTQELLSG